MLIGRPKDTQTSHDMAMGSFHKLHEELRESLIAVCRENIRRTQSFYVDAIERQKASARRKEEIMMEKKLDEAQEDFIVALYFHEQYNSPRCWRTVEVAQQEYSRIGSQTAKLRAVKEQILIRHQGLGWNEAYHPWSRSGHTFSPDELFNHLIHVVIPLALTHKVPEEPPTNLPSPPELPAIGTTADYDMSATSAYATKFAQMTTKARKERDDREKAGEGDRYSEMQQFNQPQINSLVGFKIEMYFNYQDEDGSNLCNWYHGKVVKIVNTKNRVVQVKWDEGNLGDLDVRVSNEKLFATKWNPKTVKPGAWREYLAN